MSDAMTVLEHNEKLVLENAALKQRLAEVENTTTSLIGCLMAELGKDRIDISADLWENRKPVNVAFEPNPKKKLYTLSLSVPG